MEPVTPNIVVEMKFKINKILKGLTFLKNRERNH